MNHAVRADRPLFDHLAMVYESETDLFTRLAPYLRESMDHYDRFLMVVPPNTESVLARHGWHWRRIGAVGAAEPVARPPRPVVLGVSTVSRRLP